MNDDDVDDNDVDYDDVDYDDDVDDDAIHHDHGQHHFIMQVETRPSSQLLMLFVKRGTAMLSSLLGPNFSDPKLTRLTQLCKFI